jgi:PadR family transcriptional regulator, regulatory protein PadR
MLVLVMARKPNTSAQTRQLLSVMLRQPRTWQYGYEISKQTGLTSGTLYPLLIRLSDQGLLDSQWQDPERPGKPPRHAYKLTSSGLTLARDMAPETRSTVRRKLADATT